MVDHLICKEEYLYPNMFHDRLNIDESCSDFGFTLLHLNQHGQSHDESGTCLLNRDLDDCELEWVQEVLKLHYNHVDHDQQ